MSEYDEIKRFLDDQKRTLDDQSKKLDQIHTVLAGDEYGNQGVVKDLKVLKTDYYKTKNKVDKVWWAGGIIGMISGALTTIGIKIFFKQ